MPCVRRSLRTWSVGCAPRASQPRTLSSSSEIVGQYNAQTDPSTIKLDEDKVRGWLARGAQPTAQVRKLLRTQGIDPDAR